MTIESGALEQSYAKVETSYRVTPADALSATDAINHLDLSLESKKNREASPEKRGTPDEAQSLPRRQSQNFNLASIMWEPSGTLGTISNVGKFLKAGFGDQDTLTLDTTVRAAPAPSATGATIVNCTGLEVGSVVVFNVGSAKEVTKIKTISIAEPSILPVAPVAALAGLGAGNVDDGLHNYRVVHVRPLGDTQAGTLAALTVVDKTTNGQVSLTGIAAGPAGTTARKVYRTKVGDPLAYFLLTTIADNVTTIFADNVADAGLGAALVEPAVTFDELSAAPATPGGCLSGITYKLANNVTESFAVYKYYNGGGFKQAVYGAVVDKIEAMFDGTREVLLAVSGPAGEYADSTVGTVQAKPAAHTTVGAPASGMVGNFFVGPDAFLVISAKVSVENGIELRNKELGTSSASGIAGRNNLRKVKVSLTCYLEDTRILTMANAVTVGELRILIGQTKGSMLAAILPKVEFEIPSVGNEIGPKEVTFEGIGYATSGNDQVFFAEI